MKCHPECTKTHHFQIKIKKNSGKGAQPPPQTPQWGGDTPSPPHTLPLLGDFVQLDPLRIVPGPHWGTSDPAGPLWLHSVAMNPFASVYGCVLVTTSAARQTPGGPGTTEPEAG